MRTSFRVEGFSELDNALKELPKATGKNALRRAARKALEPVMEAARSMAPVDDGTLRNSLKVATKLSKRQASIHRKMVRDDKASVEVYAGASALPQAHLSEFGTVNQAPQPFLRPAWDQNKDKVLDVMKTELGNEIEKAAKRLAKRAARKAAKEG